MVVGADANRIGPGQGPSTRLDIRLLAQIASVPAGLVLMQLLATRRLAVTARVPALVTRLNQSVGLRAPPSSQLI